MEPFPIDADEFDLHDVEANPNALDILRNAEIDEFLNDAGAQVKRVLVAGKGFGKTLILKRKAAQHRFSQSGFICVPSDRLCEKIPSFLLDIGGAWSADLVRVEVWTAVWEVTIVAAVCRATGVNLASQVERLVPLPFSAIGDVVSHLTRGIKSIRACKGLVAYSRASLRSVESRVAVFIDNVDEGLKHQLGRDSQAGRASQPEGNSVGEQVWIAAQLGLLEAIRELRHINRKVRVFATIRQEAFDRYDFQTRAQVRELCVSLSYTSQELLEIFRTRCRLVPSNRLAKPKESDPIQRFLGIRCTAVEAGGPTESTESILLRFTLGRPRDLMRVGAALLQARAGGDVDALRFVREILKVSEQIYLDYRLECVPYWCSTYERIFPLASCMVLTPSELHRISREFERTESGYLHPFCYFYHHGLLGFIDGDASRQAVQRFLGPGGFVSNSTSPLPGSRAYFFHPCLSNQIARVTLHRPREDVPELERIIVIGDGLPVPDLLFAKLQDQDSPLVIQMVGGKLRLELDEKPSSRQEWALTSLPTLLIAAALTHFHDKRTARVSFEEIGRSVDALIDRERIPKHSISGSMPEGTKTWGDVIALSLKEEKCRPLEDATKRLKKIYSGQVLTRERGVLVLDIVDPQSLCVKPA